MELFVEAGWSCDDEDTRISVVTAKAERTRGARPFSGDIDLVKVVRRDILLTISMQNL